METDVSKAAVLIGLLMVAAPLAGCVGGDGSSSTPANTTDANETPNVTGNESPGDVQEHVHPGAWKDPSGEIQDSIKLVDAQEFRMSATNQSNTPPWEACKGPNAPQGGLCLGSTTFQTGEWNDGSRKTVPPGTDRLEIKVEFSGDIAGVDVYYKDRMDTLQGRGWDTPNGTPIAESGGVATVQPSVREADGGHASTSYWAFLVDAYGNPAGAAGEQFRYGDGTITATVTAYKEEQLPVEPPHPEYWVDTDTYQVAYAEGSTGQVVQVDNFVSEDNSPPSSSGEYNPGVNWYIRPGKIGNRGSNPYDTEGQLNETVNHTVPAVPPDTKSLFLKVSMSGSAQGPSPIVCPQGSKDVAQVKRSMEVLGEGCETFDGDLEFTRSISVPTTATDSVYGALPDYPSRWTFNVQVTAPPLPGDRQGASAFTIEEFSTCFFVSTQTSLSEVPSWAKC